MKKSKRRFLVAAVVVVVVLAASAGLAFREAPPQFVHDGQVTVARRDVIEVASVAGSIEPHRQVDIQTRVAGEVMEILVEEGQMVEEGQVLFRLDPVDAQRDLAAARSAATRSRASLSEARAQLTASQATAGRAGETATLGERGVELGVTSGDEARQVDHERTLTHAEVSVREAQVRGARTQIVEADLTVAEAERTLERTEVRAPFAGTILSVDVERGAIVSSPLGNVSGGSTLMTLADLTDLRVIGQLDESQIGRVEAGQTVRFRVDAHPDRTFQGRVHRVSPLGTVDTNVVVFDVEIVVTDPDASLLRSGMSADLEIVTREHRGVLVVPITAIRSSGSAQEVTLPDGRRRTVRTGANDGQNIVVLEGLEEGDAILGDGRTAASTSAARSGLLPRPPSGGGAP